ncbi:uncharacterized protein LOC117661071 isoform X2 [Pantherophis guttatus]|nr:uncharacterized protein LOC117661071 isoform X2 [Pantherophis guttatus]
MTLTCNQSFGGDNATWWIGQHKTSLQIFQRGCYYPDGILQTHSPNFEKCPNNLSLSNFSGGGIFACKTQMEHQIQENENPVFSSKDNCTNFNFFIVARNSPTEHRSENVRRKAEEKVSIKEKQNLILSCEFELGKGTSTFAVYWFKGTKPNKCLFSASNEDCGTPFNISYDLNCCIDDSFRDRRIKSHTISRDQHRNQTHVVTITNSTTADKGSYFCVVAAYNKRYTWTIERRISVNVMEASPHNSNIDMKIFLAAIAAALLLMSGIILFLCCKKKAKGKPLESQQRDQTTVATEDCSPYAVSSHNDLNGPETVYSLATNPGEAPSTVYFSPQSKPAPGVRQGENVEALYSKVLKDKNGPSLASDSSV